ncbi:MAG: adenylosuccinate synthetase [Cyanobacteriota bacterium]
MIIVVVGAQFGDEGKGKVVDFLSEKADYVVRYQGGNNAGHTVNIESEEFKLHYIPAGIFREKKCVLGNGVVINPEIILDEIKKLEEKKVKVKENLFISNRCHIITHEHILRDIEQEKERSYRLGTTGKGIGPCYSDKISRVGIRFSDYLDNQEIIKGYKVLLSKLKPYISNTQEILFDAMDKNKNILLEGAQGTFLDIDQGTYPFVTSSNTTSAGACTGSGIPPNKIDKVIGVLKAYITRVGYGPLPTEQVNEIGLKMVDLGNEIGRSTGRKRRCGWLDLVMADYSKKLNGINEWVLTKIDVLSSFEEIKVCIGYKYNGKILNGFPSSPSILEGLEPVYKIFKGWKRDISECEIIEDLPKEAINLIRFIEEYTNTPVSIISHGSERNQNIIIKDIWS